MSWTPKVVWLYKQYRIVDLLGPRDASDYNYVFRGPRYVLERVSKDTLGADRWDTFTITNNGWVANLIMELVGKDALA